MSPSNPEPASARDVRLQRDWSGRVIAVTGLLVALAGLGYNTWRNETTEAHRNARQAGFLVLDQAAQLQQIVDLRVYGDDDSASTRIAVWGKVGLLRDVAPMISDAAGARAAQVFRVWSTRNEAIDRHDPAAVVAMDEALQQLQMQTVADLRRLQ